MSAASSSSRVPGEPQGIQPSSIEPKAARSKRGLPMPRTAKPTTSQPTTPQQQKVAGSVKSKAEALSSALPAPRSPMRPVSPAPTSEAAKTRRVFNPEAVGGRRIDRPLPPPATVKAPAAAGPAKSARYIPAEEAPSTTTPQLPTIAVGLPPSPPTGASEALKARAKSTTAAAKKAILKADDKEIKAFAKKFAVVGEGAERRIVSVKSLGIGDTVERIFTKRQEEALAKFANDNNLTLSEMAQMPGKLDAAIKGLQKPDSAKHVINWVSALTANEKVALLRALPNEVILPLYEAASLPQDAAIRAFLQQRIDDPNFTKSISKEYIGAQLFQPQQLGPFLILLKLTDKLSSKELIAFAKKNEAAFRALSPVQQAGIAGTLRKRLTPSEFQSLPKIITLTGETIETISRPGRIKPIQDLFRTPQGVQDAFHRINTLPETEQAVILSALPPEALVALYVHAASSHDGIELAGMLESIARGAATKEIVGKLLFQKQEDDAVDVLLELAGKFSIEDLVDIAQKNKTAFTALGEEQQLSIARNLRGRLTDPLFSSDRIPPAMRKVVYGEEVAARKAPPPPPPRALRGKPVAAAPLERESHEMIGKLIFQPQSVDMLARLFERAANFSNNELLTLAQKYRYEFATLDEEQQKIIAATLLSKLSPQVFYSQHMPEAIKQVALGL